MQQKAQILLSSDFSYPLVMAKNSATKTFLLELKNPRALLTYSAYIRINR